MRKSKQLYEYLNSFDHFNLREIASRIADYKEKKHIDDRYIDNNEYWKLAEQYVKDNEMYLEDEERTRKRDNRPKLTKQRYTLIHNGDG